MRSVDIFIWYLNYKAWCDEREIDPCSYEQWMAKKITEKLLWAD